MLHFNLDTTDEGVRRFILSTVLSPEGSVLELGGRSVAFIVPAALDQADDVWTEAKNQRRCDLIDRKYATGLNDTESVELVHLQEQMLRHQQKSAPWPIEDAQRLYAELLERTKTQEVRE